MYTRLRYDLPIRIQNTLISSISFSRQLIQVKEEE